MKILGERLGFGKTGALFLVGFAVVAIAGVLGYHGGLKRCMRHLLPIV
jgi:hypothetical protein